MISEYPSSLILLCLLAAFPLLSPAQISSVEKTEPVISCESLSVYCEDACLNFELHPTCTGFQGDPEITFTESEEDADCGENFSWRILRTYTAKDNIGNKATCTATITYLKRNIFNVKFPEDVTFIIHDNENPGWCMDDQGNPAPSSMVSCQNLKPGSPTIDGKSAYYFVQDKADCTADCVTSFCEIKVTYEDETEFVSSNEKKIHRTWTAEDWCGNTPYNKTQKVQQIIILNPVESAETRNPFTNR